MNDQLAKAMKNSLVEMPFSDFDQRMMMQIRKEAAAVEKAKKDKNIASFFFMLGCFFGMCCAVLAAYGQEFGGVELKSMWHAAAVVLLFLFVNSAYKQLNRTL